MLTADDMDQIVLNEAKKKGEEKEVKERIVILNIALSEKKEESLFSPQCIKMSGKLYANAWALVNCSCHTNAKESII